VAPLDVQFTDLSIGEITSWDWDFGDGETSQQQNPIHRFQLPGKYDVGLRVTGPNGFATEIKQDFVSMDAPPLIAKFTMSPELGMYPMTVQFTDRTEGIPEEREWRFGDGTTSTELNPIHEYTQPNTYRVELEVRGYGMFSTTDQGLEVSGGFVRLGCQPPYDSLTVLSGHPSIGTTVTFGLDNPLGTQNPGAVPVLMLSQAPAPNTPCGVPLPFTGMDGGIGEFLVRPGAFLIRPSLMGPQWAGTGVPAPISLHIPNILEIAGHSLWAQGVLYDVTSQVVRFGLTSGLEIKFDV
jgi:chitodextrinase